MQELPSKYLEEAVQALSSLPTIGRKSALRLAMHLMEADPDKTLRIASGLIELIQNIKYCQRCGNLADQELCQVCSNPHRQSSVVCVVESFRDILAIEDTGQYRGVYHVLGGVISPMDGIRPEDLAINSLIERCKEGKIKEIILAITPNIEGETTCYYLSKALNPFSLKLSSIARGVSFGGELEYADGYTLGHSINARLPYQTQNG